MLITRTEYNKRKRFSTNIKDTFDSFIEKMSFPQDTIFKAYTYNGKIRFVRITCEFAQIHFDLRECSKNGEPLKYGYRRGSVHKNEIAERLYEGDWIIYKTSDNEK